MALSLSGNDRIGRTHGAVWPHRALRLQIDPPWVCGVSFRVSVTASCERTGYTKEIEPFAFSCKQHLKHWPPPLHLWCLVVQPLLPYGVRLVHALDQI